MFVSRIFQGVSINLRKLDWVRVAADSKSVVMSSGVYVHQVIDASAAKNKVTS